MNYDEFKQMLKENIKSYLPPELQDMETVFLKDERGSVQMDDILFFTVENEMVNGITVHIKDLYERYRETGDLNEAITGFLQSVQNVMDVRKPFDYEHTKNHTIPQLINTKQNSQLLETVPHREWNDMSIVYRWIFGEDSNGFGSLILTNEMAEDMGITEEELYQMSLKNMKQNFPTKVQTIEEAGYELLYGQPMNNEQIPKHSPEQLYILTNPMRKLGASALLDDTALQTLAEHMQSDFYVFPTSVDEITAISSERMELPRLKEIAADAIAMAEKMGNHVSRLLFCYDAQMKVLNIAGDVTEEMKIYEETEADESEGMTMGGM